MAIILAMVQMDCRLGDKKYNLEKAAGYITEAARAGADLVCLPELFNTGYRPETAGYNWQDLAEDLKGPTISMISDVARKLKVHIVAPIAEIRDLKGVLYNSSILVDHEGKILGSYAKTHLWASERFYFRAGAEYPVFRTAFGKVGLLVCYDALFPEAARTLALKGAEILLIPAAWREVELDIWNTCLPARALENTVFLGAVNRVGEDGGVKMFGKAKIISPRGHVLAEGPEYKEGLVLHEIDLDMLKEYRAELQYLKDRRGEIYTEVSRKG